MLIIFLFFFLSLGENMPNIYLKRESYDAIIRLERDPSKFVDDAVKEKLEKEAEG